MAAVWRMLKRFRPLPIFYKPGLRNHHIDVVPRKPLVEISRSQSAFDVKVGFLNGDLPRSEVQMLTPRVKTSTQPERGLNQITRATIRTRHKSF